MEHPLLPDIYEEHLDEATFLWAQWERALLSPGYDLEETAALEGRLLAHLDGLVQGGSPVAKGLLRPALDSEEPPRISAALWALLAEPAGLEPASVVELLQAAPHEMRWACQRALELNGTQEVGEVLQQLLKGMEPAHQALALEVLTFQGQQVTQEEAQELLQHPDAQVVAAALRAVPPPYRAVNARELPRLLADPRTEIRQAALETGMMDGSRVAWDACRKALDARIEVGRVPLVLLALGGDERDIERLVAYAGETNRWEDALWAMGYSGRLEAAEKCLEMMARKPLAALAGEAFSAISGLKLEGPYVVSRQEDEELPPLEEDLEKDLEPRPEDELPEPAFDAVDAWWKKVRKQYARGTRYLRGRPFSIDGLLEELERGPMRRRPMLAMELAIRSRWACELHTRAFSPRQWAELAQARVVQARLSAQPFLSISSAELHLPQGRLEAPGGKRLSARRGELNPGSVVVTGLGLQSSLGGTIMACAAARAGIVRARELEDFPVLTEDGSQECARGHPVLASTGLRGHARLLNLGWAALEELLQQEPGLRGLAQGRTGLFLCLPDPDSRRSREPAFTGSTALRVPPLSPEGRELCARLTKLGRLPVPEGNCNDIRWGHAGPALAIHHALQRLRTRQWSRCLIGAIDSFIDAEALEWLHDVRRLRVPDKPDGIIPGEAAAFVLLERFDEARARGADILAVVTESSVTHEPENYMRRRPSTALAKIEALSQVLKAPRSQVPDEVWLISDHNGESYRAHEWGCLLMRLSAKFPSLEVNDTWFPASSFGDTGAASMLLGVCMAARAFRRGYHQAPATAILGSSDTGARGAVLLEQY